MLVLDTTTKSIVAVLAGAITTTNPDFTVAFADNTGTTFTEGANDGAFNGTSSVTIVAAPAASTRRIVKSITIENRDTAAVTVTLSYNNNATLRTVVKVTLQVGDTWTTDGTFDTNGNLKQIIGTVNLATQITGTLPVANGGTGGTTSTGSGAVVLATSPTLVTPVLGVATATSVNKVAVTAPATSATLTIADGKTLTASNSLTLAGTDATTMTFPATSTTVAGLGIVQAFSVSQRGTVTTDNDGSFDMNATNNFLCTPTGTVTLTFTNITAGQAGNIILVNSSNYTIGQAATTKVAATTLATISATGTYWLAYFSPDGTNVYVANTAALA
jgi:hypothetical protein